MKNDFKKFDLFLIDFNPRRGHVQSGVRPAILIQSNLFNKQASTLIFVPLTSVEKKLFQSEFLIQPSEKNGLQKASRFMGNQLITVDKNQVVKKLGYLEREYYSSVFRALSIVFDLENDF